MIQTDVLIMIAMIAYIVVVITVSLIYARRSNESSEDFFLGGRKLGPWVTAMSAEASDMSGWLLMGLPGVAYFTGVSDAAWTAIGLAAGTYLNWKFIAKRLRKYSQKVGNAITLPDYFSNRFHDKKKILMSVSAIFILVFFSIYVGSCFVTVGKLLNSLFGWDYLMWMILGGILVFLYTLIGGFLGESVSDFIQGIVMIFALIVVLIGGLVMVGGVENVANMLSAIPGFGSMTQIASPELGVGGFQIVENQTPIFGDPGEYGIISIISTLAWGLGYFGMPQVLLRFMAIRSSKEIKKSRIIAVTWCVIALIAAVCIGLVGRAMLPVEFLTSSDAESIFISMSVAILPPVLAGITLSGIFAATMSSSDSYMLIASSAISKNLFQGLIKKNATDKQVMWVSRIVMFLILIFGIFVAADENSSIFQVVAYAWAGFGAAFGPLVITSLFWKRVNLPGALCGMIAGGGMVFVWRLLVKPLGGIFGIYELLPAFIFGLLVLVVVSLLTKPPSEEIKKEFDTYMALDV